VTTPPGRPRHPLALVLFAALLIAGCGGDDAVEETRAGSADVPFDRAFIDAMVPHHEGAIEMADAAKQAGLSEPELVEIADAIIATQQDEIDQMREWRREWFGSADIDPAGADALAMSAEEMGMHHDASALHDAEDVDAMFASMMIDHHLGAVAMARLAEQRSEREEIRRLAREIIDAQEREIEVMRRHAAGDHEAHSATEAEAPESVDLVHVHGLAVVEAGVLLIATHHGLFRQDDPETAPRPVGETRHDLMGFTVAAPDRYLASGHPDLRGVRDDGLPPHLGLMESRDGGATWTSVSLLGEADFHVLRAAGDRIYGFDSTQGRLLASLDGGRSWEERASPGQLFDLVADPDDVDHLVATGEQGFHRSRDGGHSWTREGSEVGLLAWPAGGPLYLVGPDGAVASATATGAWQQAGKAGGQPAAFLAAGPRELFLALDARRIMHSLDGGGTWSVRVAG
jgi:uncharacterized protein (DUF305 family)